MTCHRCNGLMVAHQDQTFEGGMSMCEFVDWRCVNCGGLVDDQILRHQKQTRVPRMEHQVRHKSCRTL